MAVRVIRKLLDLIDVNADTIADGETVVWDDAAQEFIPGAGGGGGGAPSTVDYLVGTGDAGLSAEIVVGTTPGGELGGTWASPTVDATHSGSSHAAVQAAAEATAAGALGTHSADTTGVHGIADTAALALTANHPSNATFNDHNTRHENGGADEMSIAGLDGTSVELAAHLADATDAHDASAVSVVPFSTIAATNVQTALEEIVSEATVGAPASADYLVGTANGGLSAEIVVGPTPGGELGGTWASPTVDATHSGSSHAAVQAAAEATAAAALAAHTTDATDAHDASAISIVDAAGDFTATDVEGALDELQADAEADATALTDHIADATDAHDATAVSFVPDGSIAATNVQAAIVEVRDEAAGGAPNTADYLVGTAQGGLSAEIVVGATPGGELGGTWASPTIDATHSGSSHAGVQAAAEATAAAALAAHVTDASDAHDASAISVDSTTLSGTGTDVQASLEEIDNLLDDHSVRHENGGADEISVAGLSGLLADGQTPLAHAASHQNGGGDEISIAGLDGTSTELAAHLADASDAHDASAISVVSTTLSGTGTDVQAVFEEIDNLLDDHSARHENGGADEISIAGLDGTPVELTNHLSDATDAHDASTISFSPTGTIAATDVQAAIAEAAAERTFLYESIFLK